MSTLVIAEAGVNHNGDLDLAKKLVEAAAEAKADFVKFQTFRAEKLASSLAQKANYQKRDRNDESQLEMLRRLELGQADHRELLEHCKRCSVEFLSTAFDLDSLALLVSLDLEMYKVPSGEITNYPLLKALGKLNKPIAVSTGMSSLGDIEAALEVLGRDQVTLLQCTTQYPTPFEEVNLRVMETMRAAFGLPVGYSDHTLGISVPLAAVALGATIIEKHLTLDRTLPGPDQAASLEPYEFKTMVEGIRQVESCLGSPIKRVTAGEAANRKIARKSLHLARDMSAGEILREGDLVTLRPGDGISPMQWGAIITDSV
jgi:N,N'-diacetyllegionaminate synthase